MLVLLVTTSLAVVGLLVSSILDDGGGERQSRDKPVTQEDEKPRRFERADAADDPAPPPQTRTAGGFKLAGRILDGGQRPVVGARVTAYAGQQKSSGLSGEDGRFELTLTVPAYSLEVFAVGFMPHLDRLTERPYRTVEDGAVRDIVLRAAASVRGRVLDPAGGAVAGATVWIIPPDAYVLDHVHAGIVVKADGRGDFVFHGVEPGTYDIGARRAGHRPAMNLDVTVPDRGEVRSDITLKPGRAVRVNVTNGSDQTEVFAMDARIRKEAPPIPGNLTDLADAPVGRAFVAYPVYRLAGKSVTFSAMPSGGCDYLAREPGKITERGRGVIYDDDSETIALTLLDARTVPLRVVDGADGKPLEPKVERRAGDVWLAVRGTRDALELPKTPQSVVLRFSLSGYASVQHTVQPDAESIEVTMQPAAGAETGAILLKFSVAVAGRVAVIGRGDDLEPWLRHASGGEAVRFDGIPVGQYTLTVLVTGMVPARVERVVVSRGVEATHLVTLNQGGGLKFKVVDENGTLLSKVSLDLRNEEEERVHINLLTKVSGERGFVSVDYLPSAVEVSADSGLAPGSYVLRAGAEGYLPGAAEFSIAGTETAEVTVTLRKR